MLSNSKNPIPLAENLQVDAAVAEEAGGAVGELHTITVTRSAALVTAV